MFCTRQSHSNITSCNMLHQGSDDKWKTEVVVKQPWTKVEGWVLPEVPPLITDILISLDDKYLYFSNWLRGDLVQYDISDPANPKFASRIWLGGVVRAGGPIKVPVMFYIYGYIQGTTVHNRRLSVSHLLQCYCLM